MAALQPRGGKVRDRWQGNTHSHECGAGLCRGSCGRPHHVPTPYDNMLNAWWSCKGHGTHRGWWCSPSVVSDVTGDMQTECRLSEEDFFLLEGASSFRLWHGLSFTIQHFSHAEFRIDFSCLQELTSCSALGTTTDRERTFHGWFGIGSPI